MARGFKTGGRGKGIPNKATLIKEMVADALKTPEGREVVQKAVRELATSPPKNARKAVDMLRELAVISHGLVALNQPKRGADGNIAVENHDRLVQCLGIAVRATAELASFETPKFKSVVLPEIPPLPAAKPGMEEGKVASTMKKRTQQDAAEVYMRIVRGGKAA